MRLCRIGDALSGRLEESADSGGEFEVSYSPWRCALPPELARIWRGAVGVRLWALVALLGLSIDEFGVLERFQCRSSIPKSGDLHVAQFALRNSWWSFSVRGA